MVFVRCSLKETDLCSKRSMISKIRFLQEKLLCSPDSVQKAISKLKTDDDTGPIVLIKAYKKANYGNFVDILDEMNICGIARYTFVDIAWYDENNGGNSSWYCITTALLSCQEINRKPIKNGKRKNKCSCL